MTRRFAAFVASLAAFALTAAGAPAISSAALGGTKSFVVGDFDELDEGETEGAAIEADGKVTVGYLPERGAVKGSTAFTCLGTSKAALVGMADKASIQRVLPMRGKSRVKAKPKKKKAAAGKSSALPSTLKVETLAELDGVVVTAMAELPGGDIVAATLPGGKIYRVSAKGKVSTFAELKVEQIWALAVHQKRLLAATGPKGELWSMSLSGKDAKVVLDVDEKDILSIATVGKAILVGTAPRAKLYQVGDELGGILLHDFAGDELRALTVSGPFLAAAVNKFEDRKLTTLDALTKTLNRTSLVGQPPSGSLTSERPPNADAAVFAVDLGPKLDVARAGEAAWIEWLDKDKQFFTSLLPVDKRGTVLVGSSGGGKVYRVRGPRNAATVADLEERQTTALCALPKGEVFATAAHGAAVYQLRAAPAADARYRSEIFDAKYPAHYGALLMRGFGPLSVRARSGPSEKPDRRWSDWKSITLSRDGAGLRGNLAAVTKRRYLQIEVSLEGPKAELRALEVFYAPENLAPLLQAIDIDRPKVDPDDDDEAKSNVTIKWKVDERDGDDLVYDVRVRPEGADDSQWIKLSPDDELVTKKELEWDLTTVPDGVYEVEVKASDEPTNGSSKAKSDELVSAPFVVDRQRPVISGAVVDKGRIRATATDAGGYIHDVAFSIDGGPFRSASPADGLFDGTTEQLEIELPDDLSPGPHRVVIRARDSFGNIGNLAVVVKR